MEDIRPYRIEEDDTRRREREEERVEYGVSSPTDDEVPFHIPRD